MNLTMKYFLLILIISSNCIYSQNELNFSTLKIDLPQSNSKIIKPEKITSDDFFNLRYFFSPTLKDKSKKNDSGTKFQMFLDNKYGYLCELLENCENMIHYNNKKQTIPNILKIQNRYSENPKNKYNVILYPDQDTPLKEIEKLAKIFYQTKNIDKIYFAYLKENKLDTILYYNFKPNDNFILKSSENEKYKDWIAKDFKVEYGETISIID